MSARGSGLRFVAVLALFFGALATQAACGRRPVRPTDESSSERAKRDAIDPERVHAVLINGGASRAINYQSHLIHLRGVLDVLEDAGVPEDQIVVFSSDGEDPGADLATSELRPEGDDGWLLDGTWLEPTIGRPIEYRSSEIEGYTLRPATKEAIAAWFAKDGHALQDGDVLLFYVTDHGIPGSEAEGARGNSLLLWGKGASLTVDELSGLMSGLPAGVRTVALMSQCFSGGFAQLAYGEDDSLPSGAVCGYFSTTDDREAYGCYPENRGDANVGHSIDFLAGLRETGAFPAAHVHTLVNDHTPDVPLRTSDEYVRVLLDQAAFSEGRKSVEYADALLEEAWKDPSRYEPEIRLLDRIGETFGFASPRSLAEVEERLEQLPRVADPLDTHATAWHDSLGDLSQANLRRFLADHPAWSERVKPEKLKGLDAREARKLGSELVAALGPRTHQDAATYDRLKTLRQRSKTATDVNYRMQVREAALLRMQTVLLDVAARVYLEKHATPEERQALAALEQCEDLTLPVSGDVARPAIERPAFPAWSDDLGVARTVLPAWMGIQFGQAEAGVRKQRGFSEGAVSVRQVYPGSPAEAAGIEPGDVILGPPEAHFAEPRQIREWTMLSRIDEPRPLEVLHDQKVVRRTLVPKAHPGQFPELPAPPKAGDPAPPLRLSSYRAELPQTLAGGEPHLLFFWATWCAPCKAALPEVMAFAKARGVPVVAISDEDESAVDAFFGSYKAPFPETVALDRSRATFLAYGVSGTPTFVLVDGKGRVQSTATGYSAAKGLQIDGWTWNERPTG